MEAHLKFETWPIDRLIEYTRNPRKNDHAVDKIAGAIKETGKPFAEVKNGSTKTNNSI